LGGLFFLLSDQVRDLDLKTALQHLIAFFLEFTGLYLFASDVHCHHYIPLHLGGSDKFNNLRILHKEVHRLIHQTHKETIEVLISRLGIIESMVNVINQYRKRCGLEPI
jgi:RNA-directed DNA polymerase